MTKAQQPHGGKRAGSGRKPIDANAQTVTVTMKMSLPQKEKLKRLGGAPWVRDRIDKAKDPSAEPPTE